MIKESYNDTFLVEIKKDTYEKIKDIIYFEEEDKKEMLERLKSNFDKIIEKTNITKIDIEEKKSGYLINYMTDDTFLHSIFCYTLTEVTISLRSFLTK